MGDASIGIRVANGTFYPVLTENSSKQKRLILTTVKDNQASVQIDLFRQQEGSEVNEYIGSLVVENIEAGTAGTPGIELVVGVSSEGVLSARAKDLSTGEHQSLSVNLSTLDDEKKFEIPEFDLEDPADRFSPPDEEFVDSSQPFAYSASDNADFERSILGDEDDDVEQSRSFEIVSEPKDYKLNPIALFLFVLSGLAIIAAATFVIIQLVKGLPQPPLEAMLDFVRLMG